MSKLGKFEIVMYIVSAAIVIAGVLLMIFGSPGAGAQVSQQGLKTGGAAGTTPPPPPALAAAPKTVPTAPAAPAPAPAAAAPAPPPPAALAKAPPAPVAPAVKPAPAPTLVADAKVPPPPPAAAPKTAPAPAADLASAPAPAAPRELGLTDGAEYFRGRKIRASLTVAQNVSGVAATAGQGAELYTKNERLKQEEVAQAAAESGTPGGSGSGDSYSYRTFIESDRSV